MVCEVNELVWFTVRTGQRGGQDRTAALSYELFYLGFISFQSEDTEKICGTLEFSVIWIIALDGMLIRSYSEEKTSYSF